MEPNRTWCPKCKPKRFYTLARQVCPECGAKLKVKLNAYGRGKGGYRGKGSGK